MSESDKMRELVRLLEADSAETVTVAENTEFSFIKQLNESAVDEGVVGDTLAAVNRTVTGIKGSWEGGKEYRKITGELNKSLMRYLSKANLKLQETGKWKEAIIDWLERIEPRMMQDPTYVAKINGLFGNREAFSRPAMNKLALDNKGKFLELLSRIVSKWRETNDNGSASTSPSAANTNAQPAPAASSPAPAAPRPNPKAIVQQYITTDTTGFAEMVANLDDAAKEQLLTDLVAKNLKAVSKIQNSIRGAGSNP